MSLIEVLHESTKYVNHIANVKPGNGKINEPAN